MRTRYWIWDGKLLSNIANINTNINFIGLEVYESVLEIYLNKQKIVI